MTHPSPLTNHSTRVTNLTPITSYKKGPLGWHGHSVGIPPHLTRPPHHNTSILWGPRGYAVGVGFRKQSLDIFLASVHLNNPSKIITGNPVSHWGGLPASHCAALCLQGSDHTEHAGKAVETLGCSPCLERLWAKPKCQAGQIRLKRVLAAGPCVWTLLRSQFLPLPLPHTCRERLRHRDVLRSTWPSHGKLASCEQSPHLWLLVPRVIV